MAAVTEMIHSASLIVDDIIDNSTVRREQPTMWASVGEKNALKISNLIVSQSINILTQLDSKIKRSEIIYRMSEVLNDLVAGEVFQKQCAEKLKTRTMNAYGKTCYLKTGSLFANSFRCAAILNAVEYPDKSIGLASKLGKNVGMAFQIADDILDYTSNLQQLGNYNYPKNSVKLPTTKIA